MTLRRVLVACLVLVLAGVLAVFTVAAPLLPTDLRWRVSILGAKLTGRLPDIPIRELVTWLRPGSPVYLASLAGEFNPHSGIKNRALDDRSANRGEEIYRSTCGTCHGEGGYGDSGPDLIEAVGNRSDWSFFSAAKWGRPGTSMQAQPIGDVDIWRVHSYLRRELLRATTKRDASVVGTSTRKVVSVAAQRLIDAAPEEWLTYGGGYAGHRHSLLPELTKTNVSALQLSWVAQLPQIDRELEASPLVADGMMYVTQSRSGVVALDARTGAIVWTYKRDVPDDLSLCCGMPNRGVALLDQSVYVTTIDNFLVSLDANTGKQRWNTRVADYRDGITMTGAPLALPDRIVVGMAGGEYGARGFIAAYDPVAGKELWRFNTVPGPGEKGHETWGGESWKMGGGPTWTAGAYDPKEDLLFWGVGNPAPEFRADVRPGDNLFTNSVVALEAKTGKLRWHYQFTPADDHDWDSNQQPVLAEIEWQGARRPVVLWANRNGFFYALDRRTGEFLFAQPFVKQTWNEGFDAKGKPKIAASARPTPTGALVWPAPSTATNWWPPAYDASRQLVFLGAGDAAGVYYSSPNAPAYTRGGRFDGGSATPYARNHPTVAYMKAIDAQTGKVRWETLLEAPTNDEFIWSIGAALSTAGGVVFSGYRDTFRAFDSDTGKVLWQAGLGGRVRGVPIAYAIDGRQHVAILAGHSVFVFKLP
jgi:alcohol dehydrogenase (cytochrome c)